VPQFANHVNWSASGDVSRYAATEPEMRLHSKDVALTASMTALIAATWVVSYSPQASPSAASPAAKVVDVPLDLLATQSRLYDPVASVVVPQEAQLLHGRRVRVAGVMHPVFPFAVANEYAFIPETRHSTHRFCSDQRYPLHAVIPVSTPTGVSEAFQKSPFVLEGILEVDIQSEGGYASSLYRIRDARIVDSDHKLQYSTVLQ
jgi:hypothetical protein